MLMAAAALLAGSLLIFYRQHSRSRLDSSVRLAMAVESYSRDYVARGQRLPPAVTLRDLVNGGYITAREVRALDGLAVTIYPTASTDPQAILVRVLRPDGVQYVTLANGNIRRELPK